VEGPTCKIKKTGGLFNSYASLDRYATGLTRRSRGSGPSVPDPTASDSSMHLSGGARPEDGGARRSAVALSPKLAESRLPTTKLCADCTYTKLERRRSQPRSHTGGLGGGRGTTSKGADGRQPASGGAMHGSREIERGWGRLLTTQKGASGSFGRRGGGDGRG
jgi:hypothetical protein